MKLLLKLLLLSLIKLNLLSSTLELVGTFAYKMSLLAKDIYQIETFEQKYKNSTNKLNIFTINGVSFAVLDEQERTYLVFQGTNSKKDMLTDASIGHSEFKNNPSFKVHHGFYTTSLLIQEKITIYLSKDKKIITIGHSLGGAISLMLGALLSQEGYDISVYSFGAPPIGNKAFIESINTLEHFRYLHKLDIIPKLNQNNVGKFKKILDFTSNKLENSVVLKPTIDIIKKLPYEFVHHGKMIELTYKIDFSQREFSTKKEAFLRRTLLLPLEYHSIKTYVEGMEKLESSTVSSLM